MTDHSTNQITVAESLVLRDPGKQQGRAALKLTLIDMLARHILIQRHEERRGFLGRVQKTVYLQLAPDAGQRTSSRPHVRAVINALAAAGAAQGVTMEQVVKQARSVFGSDLSGFQSNYVLPSLLDRGLLEAYKAKVLLIFSTTRYRHTPAGTVALQRIEEEIAKVHTIPGFLESNPAQAAALALALGSTMLLVDEMKPFYSRLSTAMQQHTGDGGGGGYAFGSDSSSESFDDSFDFDMGGFDTLDSSLDSFDSSFDSSADSGGGDGGSDGGGDGGGGE